MSQASKELHDVLVGMAQSGELEVPTYHLGKLEEIGVETYKVSTDSGNITAKFSLDNQVSVGSKVLVLVTKSLSVVLGAV